MCFMKTLFSVGAFEDSSFCFEWQDFHFFASGFSEFLFDRLKSFADKCRFFYGFSIPFFQSSKCIQKLQWKTSHYSITNCQPNWIANNVISKYHVIPKFQSKLWFSQGQFKTKIQLAKCSFMKTISLHIK